MREVFARDLGRDYAWPGNVRELEQAVRHVLLDGRYPGDTAAVTTGWQERLTRGIEQGAIEATALLRGYCAMLYERHGTYEEVARRTGLDRRTVKRYVQEARQDALG